jgi:hypothetical protein
MNQPLKKIVRERIELDSLTNAQLKNLESFSDQVLPKNNLKKPIYPFAIAGAFVAFILAFMLSPLVIEQGNISERIALEVVTNHIKLKPLEIETSSMGDIRNYFKKLDFLPVNSQLVNDAGLKLIGGRYCSLQGVTAAQLRVKKPNSNVVQTLYQTEYRKDIFENMPQLEEGERPVSIYVKGIKVKIWVEKGVLFALTGLPDN